MEYDLLNWPFDAGELLQKKRRIKRELLQKPGLVPKKIALLSGVTLGETKNMLELFLLANGIQPTFYEGEYGLFYENLLYDDGSLRAFAPDVIYLHTSSRNIQSWPLPTDSAEEADRKLSAEAARFEAAIRAGLGFGCPVICTNFDLPVYRVMGNLDAVDRRGRVRFVRKLNDRMGDLAESVPNLYLNDLAYLQARHGMDAFSDQTAWYGYKYPCALALLPYLCQNVANIIKSLFGRNRKALALDLDNTLWGGVIGDDGPEGIVLGSESPAGMAYSEFQQYLKQLGQLGILLNVDSKNLPETAEAGFAREDSVLKKDDFVCFKANYQPKSENLAAMAQEINILTDSFVFVDDNPAEREIVRQQLPGVAVPELGAPEDYIKSIDRSGYFEMTALSSDDRNRTQMYKQNAQRAQLQQQFGDYDEYLKSLGMTGVFGAFDAPHAERITQLINKSNQFNLTTRRYSAAEIEGLIGNDDYITLHGRLIDKFGDNGLVAIVIGHLVEGVCDLDLWVMSCRVLKRKMEHAMFDRLVEACRARGVRELRGHYYPTAKNLLVKDFYDTIGFELMQEDADGNREYRYLIPADWQSLCTVMEIERI